MALLNPSFEESGLVAGEAAHWTLKSATSRQAIAGFGSLPEIAWEDFERWFELLSGLGAVATTRAFFNAARDGFEPFERGWTSGVYLRELSSAVLVPLSFGPDGVESCEEGWQSAPFFRNYVDVPSASAVFDGEPLEDFEDAWRLNELYRRSWGDLASTAASFDGGVQSVEDFENGWAIAVTQ